MSKRIPHLDNLRSAMVLAVVLLHAALAYNQWAVWWYASDQASIPGFDLLTLLLDVFPLPVLFFLAGYFAVPSKAKGGGAFVLAKLKRLGIPLVMVTAATLPVIPWIALTSRGLPAPPLASFWFSYLGHALIPDAALIQTMPDYSKFGEHFSQFHLWFISLLLCFFLLYALVPKRSHAPESRTSGRILATLALAGTLMALAMAALATTMQEWSWLNLDWLLFQPVRIPLYLGFFMLGILAWRGDWLRSGSLPGPLWAWIIGTVLMLAVFLAVSPRLMLTPEPLAFPMALAQQAIRVLFCLAWLGMFLGLFRVQAKRSPRGDGRLSASLAASSYDIYLLHLPVCVVFQYLLLDAALPGLLKFALVLAGTIVVSWGLSLALRMTLKRLASALGKGRQAV